VEAGLELSVAFGMEGSQASMVAPEIYGRARNGVSVSSGPRTVRSAANLQYCSRLA